MKTIAVSGNRRPEPPSVGLRKYVVYQFLILGALIGITFLNEALDVPHRVLGAAPTSVGQRAGEIFIEIVSYTLIVGIEISLIRKLYQAIHLLEGFITICTECKRVRYGSDWETMEAYITEHPTAYFTHSLCPDCMEILYPELVEDLKRQKESHCEA